MTERRRDAFDLIVIGGGPAGMMAAGCAAEGGRRVLLLDRGPSPGRKLLITAGGRCNVTNTAPLPDFLRAFGRHGGFLRDAATALDSTHFRDWLRARGVETVEEVGGRVYPGSNRARTVLQCLTKYMESGGVEVKCGCRAEALLIEEGVLKGVRASGSELRAPNVLIATGGLSYPATGATGDGYRLAAQGGHTIAETYPAVTAFEVSETWPKRIQGTPTQGVMVRAFCNGKRIAEASGDAMWAHYGAAGPVISDVSTNVVQAMRKGGEILLRLDLRPADSVEALDQWLVEAAAEQGRRRIANVISARLPQRVAEVIVELAGIDVEKRMNACSKAERRRLAGLMKRLDLHVSRPRPIEEAIVTGGGVVLSEVDPRTMQSRLLNGLYFAGEVLDLAGPCGGFNLQAAFSTGYLVGESLVRND